MTEPIDEQFEEYIDPNERSPFESIKDLEDALIELAGIVAGGE